MLYKTTQYNINEKKSTEKRHCIVGGIFLYMPQQRDLTLATNANTQKKIIKHTVMYDYFVINNTLLPVLDHSDSFWHSL